MREKFMWEIYAINISIYNILYIYILLVRERERSRKKRKNKAKFIATRISCLKFLLNDKSELNYAIRNQIKK